MMIIVVLLIIWFLYAEMKMIQFSRMKPTEEADYLILLGAKVNGSKPSLALQYRIDKAAAYLGENKRTIAVCSGGKGDGENISEAAAMKQGLMNLGISESRIIIEDKSRNTEENMKFSSRLLSKDMKKGVVATNDYHLFRSMKLAADNGLTVSGLPAKTPGIILIQAHLRECLSIAKYYIMKAG
ncbi:YdcF family protein [Metabacillus sp. GX 13764]|uniref:YdcF family protein n=1 Tax=Metabacillus kandeliae TaxID=2900151 RepID=UPI001E62976A|nr:YdcF family protein [Metabacillus kandeliae]MCD7036156.1 YdcF family protein [Metabacillus kandeliae]